MRRSDFRWDAVPVKSGTTANPAAGANPAAVTVPAGKRWRFLLGRCRCVNDANVASRYPQIVVGDGTNEIGRISGTLSATAGVTWTATNGDISLAGVGSIIMVSHGALLLGPGYTVNFSVGSLQAGDDCEAYAYEYQEAEA